MPSRAVYTGLALSTADTGWRTVLIPIVEESLMVTPEVMVSMSMTVMLGAARDRRFSIPDRSGHLFRHARWHPRCGARLVAPVGAGRHADQLGEATAERAQRRAPDRETDLGDAEVAATQQRHGALDASRHDIAVRRLAVGELELTAEMPGRHVRAAGQRLNVQRLRVLPVDPVANAAQPGEVTQVLGPGGCAGHTQDRATSDRKCLAPLAQEPEPEQLPQ